MIKIFIFSFFSMCIWPVETGHIEYRIDYKFEAGNNLIYDCHKKHFLCANDDSFLTCEETRELEKTKKELSYSCIPIKKFKTKEECVGENYRLIYRPVKNSLCKKN